jgi:hypothetical protein
MEKTGDSPFMGSYNSSVKSHRRKAIATNDCLISHIAMGGLPLSIASEMVSQN